MVIENLIECKYCKLKASIDDRKIIFSGLIDEGPEGEINKLKRIFKRNNLLYSFLIKVVSPICPSSAQKKFIKDYVKGKNVVAINFGSGSSDISSDISNVDFFNYERVDLVCDIINIPIKDNSVDCILNVAVLEHVKYPEVVVAEFNRILKKGGRVFLNFPFIQGFHSSPHDYSRRTTEGLATLFKDFKIEKIGIVGGPTSALLWIIQEWLAIVFSFGWRSLHDYLYVLFMVLSFPLKYLDIILKWHPSAKNISSNFYVVAKKE